ncbi:hypothetical protein [Paenibacillus lemnae]|uniref:Uncharacterized protein n=1 Tax=Paenibacillus lemnae TaxID=1330551 RepID=A0A848M0N2_PAELE|nr:hypothetical protein [Paenibacillus lemnae]NMO94325.1 hypothetical protein [Paenibacillus lemnae]
MINDRMIEIEEAINKLTIELLVPLRTSKKVNKEAFDKLYALLEELKELVKGEVLIRRKLAGLLFFIYSSISAEGEHTHYSDPIFIEAGKLEDYLSKILWDSPFGKGF